MPMMTIKDLENLQLTLEEGANRHSIMNKNQELKSGQNKFQQWESEGKINLYYLDETGFCLTTYEPS
jgi:hypothetical protein